MAAPFRVRDPAGQVPLPSGPRPIRPQSQELLAMPQKPSRSPSDDKPAAAAPPPQQDALQLVENLHAPEFYADEATFFASRTGNAAITFTSYRFDNSIPGGVLRKVVTARLVMPAAAAQALAASLFDFLKKQGVKVSAGPAN